MACLQIFLVILSEFKGIDKFLSPRDHQKTKGFLGGIEVN